MSTAFQANGAQSKPTKYAALWSDQFFTGLWTQRNPLRDAATPFLYRRFYGATRYESLWDGLNIEMSSRLTLIRRPGHTVFNSQTFPAVNSFYEFRKFSSGAQIIQLVADTGTGGGVIYDSTPPSTKTTIFTKSAAAGEAYFQSVGNTLYFGDDAETIKYQAGSTGWVAQNWGISTVSGSGSFGPRTTTAGTNLSGSGVAWVNPGNVTSAVSYATVTLPATGVNYSTFLAATGFGFTLSSGTIINGASITFGGSSSISGTIYVGLAYAGTLTSYLRPVTLGIAPSTVTVGGPGDSFGLGNIAVSLANASSFGVIIFSPNTGLASVTSVNNVKMTLYSSSIPSATPAGVGTFSATVGYRYVYCYGNSIDGGCSSASQPTVAGIGADVPFSGYSYVGVTVQASSDTQVNQIRVFRTADGGAVYYELPTSPYPNTTATIQDSSPDSSLNLFSQAPLNHYNDPPPNRMNRPTYHVGLMWGAVDNFVLYSRPNDQSVPGVSVQCFPPSNYFEFPSKVIRLIPTIFGLLVFLTDSIWLIQGTGGTASPFLPVSFVPLIGIASYDALTQNGALLYFYTSDRQFVSLDPNAGVSEVGFPIGDLLENSFDPLLANVTYHPGGSSDKAVFITDGSVSWYRVSPVATPEQGQMISPVGQPVGGFSCVQSVEVTGGSHALLLAPSSSGPILKRDLSVVTDNGTPYYANVTIGSLVLAQPGQMAEMSFVTLDYKGEAAGGSAPFVFALLDDTQGVFENLYSGVNDPPTLPPSTYTVGNRYYFSLGGKPAWCRHLQILLQWNNTATFDEIRSFTLYGAHHQEK